MLRPGDIVTLTVRPPVRLTQYQFLKSGASITRTLGEQPLEDIREMRRALPRLYAEAVGQDLGIFTEMSEILADDDAEISDLKSWIVEHADGSEEESVQTGKAVSSKKAKASKRLKGTGKKKARRRAVKGKT